jgi:tRNA pseudouridine55 synthase
MHYLDPPQFSAIKHKGRPLYKYAREGVKVESPPRATYIEAFRLLERTGDRIAFELTCSRGTYVRAVVHALGRRLGCGACLESLRRTECGRFRIEDAHSIEGLEARIEGGKRAEALLTPAQVLDHLEGFQVREQSEKKVRHGSPLRDDDLEEGTVLEERMGQKVRVMIRGKLGAVAEVRSDPQGAFLQPLRVLLRAA